MSPACRPPNAAIPPRDPGYATSRHAAIANPTRTIGPAPTPHLPQPSPSMQRNFTPYRLPPNGEFGSIRSPVTACRRRVGLLMLQFPPTSHVRAAEMRCNRTTLPTPRRATRERRAMRPTHASSRHARTPRHAPHPRLVAPRENAVPHENAVPCAPPAPHRTASHGDISAIKHNQKIQTATD